MKKPVIQWIMILLALGGLGTPAWAKEVQKEPFQEGVHYFLIENAPVRQEGPIELQEAFSYLCTHCNTFDPYVRNWLERKPEGVKFSRIPVVFGRSSWELYARGYVTAEMMEAPEQAHVAMFDLLWKDKKIMRSLDELADFYAQFGLDKERFKSTFQSFAVDGKLRKDQQLVQAYGVRGTPTLILDGRYRIAGSAAVPNYDVMFDVVDYLIQKEMADSKQARVAAD